MKVFGTGFALTMSGGLAFMQRLETISGSEVVVAIHRAPAATTALRAYAVCFPVVSPLEAFKRENIEPIDTVSGTFPHTVTVAASASNMQVYGVGGRVSGDNVDDITIDALIPAPATNQAHVQVNRVLPLDSPLRLNAAALASITFDPDEVSATTEETGTFC
jgi:hypothetical protein